MSIPCAMMRIDPGGYFLAQPETIGTSVEEMMKFEIGAIDVMRGKVIVENLSNAAIWLQMAVPMGRC